LDHDPAPARTLAMHLNGERGDEAALLLARMGDIGVQAVASVLPVLENAGARHAIRLLATQHTHTAATALVAALGRPEIADQARSAIQRLGSAALEPLASVLPSDARAAPLILSLWTPTRDKLRAMAAGLVASREIWREIHGHAVALVAHAAREG